MSALGRTERIVIGGVGVFTLLAGIAHYGAWASIIAFLSETCTLEPGDVILTGTPSGVGMSMDPPRFLGSGDVVRIEIEQLGTIEHAVA